MITKEPTLNEGNYISAPIFITEHISNNGYTVISRGIREPIIRTEHTAICNEITEPIIKEYTKKGDGFTGSTVHDYCTAFMNRIAEPTVNNGNMISTNEYPSNPNGMDNLLNKNDIYS